MSSEELFGGLAISFWQLLQNLKNCGCTVRTIAAWGAIIDTDQSTATMYEITRREGTAEWYAHIDIYSHDLPVLPDQLRSISVQLNLPIEKLLWRPPQ